MADRMADLEARVAALEMIFSGKPDGVTGPPVPEQVHDVVEPGGEVHPQSVGGDKGAIVLDGSHDEERAARDLERDEAARKEAEKATHADDEKPTAEWLKAEETHRRPRPAAPADAPKPAAARPEEHREPTRPANRAVDAHNQAPDAHKPEDKK